MDTLSNCQFKARPHKSGFFEKGKAYQSVKRFLATGLMFLLFFVTGQTVYSQIVGTYPINIDPNSPPGCPQNNVTISDVEFRDTDGNILDPYNVNYNIGDNVEGEIWVKFGGSSSNAYNLYLQYDVVVNDVPQVPTNALCLFSGQNVPNQTGLFYKISDFNWTYGDKIEIKNIYMTWTTGNAGDGSCSAILRNSQCYYTQPGLLVRTPLVANFDFVTNCDDFTVDFIDLTTGGDPADYTYTWTFTNGNPATSSVSDPQNIDFTQAGSYSVTLEVESEGITKSLEKTVVLNESIEIVVSNKVDDDCTDSNTGSIDITVSGGDGNYTFQWSTLDGSGLVTDAEDQTGLSAGTYTVLVTDGETCSETIDVLIIKPDPSPMPSPASFDYCVDSGDQLLSVVPISSDYEITWYDENMLPLAVAPTISTATADTYTYYITQTRIDGTECESGMAQVTVNVAQCSIALVKEYTNVLSPDNCLDPTTNPTINYSFTVTNNGTYDLSNIQITDPLFEAPNPIVSLTRTDDGDGDVNDILSVGETWVYEASYAITATDIQNGQVENQATVSGVANGHTVEDLSGSATDNDNPTIVPICQDPVIEIIKTGVFNDENNDTYANVGETITYTFEVSNGGDVSLTTITVTDPLPGLSSIDYVSGDTGDDDILEVGETWIYTATYAVTQDDINTGQVDNTATADSDESEIDTDSETVNLPQNPVLNITKTVDPTSISAPATLNYTITVTNEGNVSLTGVVVTDPFTDGVTPLVLDNGDTDNDGELDLDETWVYYASYDADQDDIDAGDDIVNTAFVNSNETEQDEASATTTITQSAAIDITKTVDPTSISAPATLNYTITVTNEGNVSLTGVVVTDPFTDGVTPLVLDNGDTDNDGELDLDETWVYYASYDADQDDIDAGDDIVNTAFVNSNETEQDEASATTTITQSAAIDITKTVDPTSISAPATLNYTITVTNEGNVSLTGVVVTDPFTDGVTPLVLDNGDTDNDGELDLDETWVYYASYDADQDDIDAGDDIVNTAFVNSNETEQDEASATTTITQSAAIDITKTVDPTSISAPATLNYTITV
ncbi:membrane protein, partial [Algoriphagus machipongonensis]